MTVEAPPRPEKIAGPLDPEALFAEARRHRRRRRLRTAASVVAVLVVAGATYGAVRDGSAVSGSNGGATFAAAAPARAVVLLVDVSGSMRADDVKPTRLDAAVAAMTALVDRLPAKVEVGLVSFSTAATIVQRPTTDRARIRAALRSLEPQAGTALGAGVASAVALTRATLEREGIEREPGELAPAAIVLESDGAQNRGRPMPLHAAALARQQGIRIYGVALGTRGGTVSFGFAGSPTANRIPVPPDPSTVRAIARTTGGRSYAAGSAGALAAAYRQIADRLAGH